MILEHLTRHARILVLLAGIVLVHAPAPAQSTGSRVDAWRQDISFAATEIPKRHPNFFTRTSQADFTVAVAALQDAVPGLSDKEVIVGIARIIALGSDGHTSLSLRQAGAGMRLQALRFRWLSDGLFVTSATAQLVSTLGARVVAIEGLGLEDAYRKVREAISYDSEATDTWARFISENYLASGDILFAQKIAPSPERVTYTLEKDGIRFDVTAPVVDGNLFRGPQLARQQNPIYTRNPTLFYWFDYLPEARAIYFQYNACQLSPALSMVDFVNQLGTFALSQPVERLIVDLRANQGGNTVVLEPFLGVLQEAAAAGVINLTSGAAAIIGRQTFSSAVVHAIDFKKLGIKLVGETAGWDPARFGEVLTLQLPNSGLEIRYSTRRFQIPGAPGPVVPDVPVDFTAADYFVDRDPWLEAALRVAGFGR